MFFFLARLSSLRRSSFQMGKRGHNAVRPIFEEHSLFKTVPKKCGTMFLLILVTLSSIMFFFKGGFFQEKYTAENIFFVSAHSQKIDEHARAGYYPLLNPSRKGVSRHHEEFYHPDTLKAWGFNEAASVASQSEEDKDQLLERSETMHDELFDWASRKHLENVASDDNVNEDEPGSIPILDAVHEDKWNYLEHGRDWKFGKCLTGDRQSPVDLHIEGLQEPQFKNLTNVYLAAFTDDFSTLPGAQDGRNFKPWNKGDVFYTYPNSFNKVDIYKTDKVFQIRAPQGSLTNLGALFSTDTAEMYVAQHIMFHSPSEHTFQGEANRREIEMQIWHYSNDLLSYEASKDVNYATLPYLALFAQSSLNLPEVENAMTKNFRTKNDPYLPSSHWRVISLTFMSEELDQATLQELKNLPSEKTISTLLSAELLERSSSGESKSVDLPHPLNLQSLMMMLQLTNIEFFAYDGSNTVPGCKENVRWYVARQPLPVATETMLRFYKMLNPRPLKSLYEKDGNFRTLQNTQENMHNSGNVFLVQGFPVQLLIANTIGFDVMAKIKNGKNEPYFSGWFGPKAKNESPISTTAIVIIVLVCIILLAFLISMFLLRRKRNKNNQGVNQNLLQSTLQA